MKQVPADKYTVAWFKLAECIARGEKERALGVYRLLAHSFSDVAYKNQLEGDILFAFNDIESAIDKYKQAAHRYAQEGRLLQAVALYEHIVGIKIEEQALQRLVELCSVLGFEDKTITYQKKLIFLLLENKDVLAASALLKKIDADKIDINSIMLHTKLIMELARHTDMFPGLALYHMKKVVDGLLVSNDQGALQRFLSSLQAIDEMLYLQAVEYLETVTKQCSSI